MLEPNQEIREQEKNVESMPEPEVKLPSSCREMRIKAEKDRRDRLKKSTEVLAVLVPSVARASKRPDKTSILRLSANFITLHRCFNRNNAMSNFGSAFHQTLEHFLESGVEKMYNMFFMILFTDGKILYVSERVEKILGHPQVDLLNECIYRITLKEEYPYIQRELDPSHKPSKRRRFYCHMIERGISRSDPGRVVRVLVQGRLVELDVPQKKRSSSRSGSLYEDNEYYKYYFLATVSPSPERPLSKINLLHATRDEYFTRHLFDGRIVDVDHRISSIAGYFTRDVIGNPALEYMTPDDKLWIGMSLQNMISTGTPMGVVTYKLITAAQTVIYMRTQGFIETTRSASGVPTLVCINSLIDAENGEMEIIEQRKTFEMLLASKSRPVYCSSAHLLKERPGNGGTFSSAPNFQFTSEMRMNGPQQTGPYQSSTDNLPVSGHQSCCHSRTQCNSSHLTDKSRYFDPNDPNHACDHLSSSVTCFDVTDVSDVYHGSSKGHVDYLESQSADLFHHIPSLQENYNKSSDIETEADIVVLNNEYCNLKTGFNHLREPCLPSRLGSQ